jgi:hypothetical protein
MILIKWLPIFTSFSIVVILDYHYVENGNYEYSSKNNNCPKDETISQRFKCPDPSEWSQNEDSEPIENPDAHCLS